MAKDSVLTTISEAYVLLKREQKLHGPLVYLLSVVIRFKLHA